MFKPQPTIVITYILYIHWAIDKARAYDLCIHGETVPSENISVCLICTRLRMGMGIGSVKITLYPFIELTFLAQSKILNISHGMTKTLSFQLSEH